MRERFFARFCHPASLRARLGKGFSNRLWDEIPISFPQSFARPNDLRGSHPVRTGEELPPGGDTNPVARALVAVPCLKVSPFTNRHFSLDLPRDDLVNSLLQSGARREWQGSSSKVPLDRPPAGASPRPPAECGGLEMARIRTATVREAGNSRIRSAASRPPGSWVLFVESVRKGLCHESEPFELDSCGYGVRSDEVRRESA